MEAVATAMTSPPPDLSHGGDCAPADSKGKRREDAGSSDGKPEPQRRKLATDGSDAQAAATATAAASPESPADDAGALEPSLLFRPARGRYLPLDRLVSRPLPPLLDHPDPVGVLLWDKGSPAVWSKGTQLGGIEVLAFGRHGAGVRVFAGAADRIVHICDRLGAGGDRTKSPVVMLLDAVDVVDSTVIIRDLETTHRLESQHRRLLLQAAQHRSAHDAAPSGGGGSEAASSSAAPSQRSEATTLFVFVEQPIHLVRKVSGGEMPPPTPGGLCTGPTIPPRAHQLMVKVPEGGSIKLEVLCDEAGSCRDNGGRIRMKVCNFAHGAPYCKDGDLVSLAAGRLTPASVAKLPPTVRASRKSMGAGALASFDKLAGAGMTPEARLAAATAASQLKEEAATMAPACGVGIVCESAEAARELAKQLCRYLLLSLPPRPACTESRHRPEMAAVEARFGR